MMMREITIQNPVNGKLIDRPANTYTIDVPADFDRQHGVLSVDAKSLAQHTTADGRSQSFNAMTRPLSWRVYGEECLVADRAGRGAAAFAGTYHLRSIKPPA